MNIKVNKTATATFTAFTFSGGEVQVRLSNLNIKKGDTVNITTRLTSSDAIMELLLVVDAIRHIQSDVRIELTAAYLPYARQDRVCASGEALSLKVVCSLINGLNLDKVLISDSHSDVSAALLNNVSQASQLDIITRIPALDSLLNQDDVVIVAPDAGASKKAMAIATHYQRPFVQALKNRCTETGAILATTVCGDIEGKHVVIADDICDGGATFIALAKSLRAAGAKHITLYVTHGIFAKGLDIFNGLIDSIYTTDSFRPTDEFDAHASLNVTAL